MEMDARTSLNDTVEAKLNSCTHDWQRCMIWVDVNDGTDSLEWLQWQYGAPFNLKSAIVYGNESAATAIKGWFSAVPAALEPPDWIYIAPKESDA